jgi:hypothetical protein
LPPELIDPQNNTLKMNQKVLGENACALKYSIVGLRNTMKFIRINGVPAEI